MYECYKNHNHVIYDSSIVNSLKYMTEDKGDDYGNVTHVYLLNSTGLSLH